MAVGKKKMKIGAFLAWKWQFEKVPKFGFFFFENLGF
jgi:hypothetical protein